MLMRLTCDCGREYALAVEEPEEVDEGGSVEANQPKEADHVPRPVLEVDATPAYEDPSDPYWEPDAAEENETRIHEADPIELREAPDIPTIRRRRRAVGF